MSTYETFYMSAALKFENKFVRYAIEKIPLLFQEGHIQQLMKDNSLHDLVLTKKEQYSHVRDDYPCYWDDSWKKFSDLGFAYENKQIDTTTVLADSIISDLHPESIMKSANRLIIEVDQSEINRFIPYAHESIINRNSKAITKALFEENYCKLGISKSIQRCYNIKITEHYINTYLLKRDGTISTGLSSGIGYFDYLCPTFPAHHIKLWIEIYKRIGVKLILETQKFTAENIYIIRESVEFQKFVDEVRFFIERVNQKSSFTSPLVNSQLNSSTIVSSIVRKFRACLNDISPASETVDGIKNVLRQAALRLESLDDV